MRIKVHLEGIYEGGLGWFMMTKPPREAPHFLTVSYKNILKMRFSQWRSRGMLFVICLFLCMCALYNRISKRKFSETNVEEIRTL